MSDKVVEVLPVLLSPLVERSEDVFEYEKPTPTGESRNIMLATATYVKIVKSNKYTTLNNRISNHTFSMFIC